jgi:hypothetical protein
MLIPKSLPILLSREALLQYAQFLVQHDWVKMALHGYQTKITLACSLGRQAQVMAINVILSMPFQLEYISMRAC